MSNITGSHFGKLKALHKIGLDKNRKNSIWLCECLCGNTIEVVRSNLIQGHTKSCGCLGSPPDNIYEIEQEKRFFRFVEKTESCWIWRGCLDKQGYGMFNYRCENIKSHRYSFSRFKHPIVGGYFICHTCDNRSCVNPDHLYLGTHQDNMNDIRDRKTWGNKRKKYSELQKKAIKVLNANGFSSYEIAELLKISSIGVKNHADFS